MQMLIGRIRLSCITQGSSWYWGRDIRDAVLAINTRYIRIYGYSPAEILLGFNPAITRTSRVGLEEWLKRSKAEPSAEMQASERDIHFFVDLREERRLIAGKMLAQ